MRPRRTAHDRQHHSPARRSLLLRVVPGPAVPVSGVVEAPGEMSSFSFLPFAAAFCSLLLAVLSVVRRKPSVATWCFCAGMIALCVDCVFTGFALRATQLAE